MKHINELQEILHGFLHWHKSRVHCMTQILQALFPVRTINLTQIANAFHSKAKTSSSYRRICRFFTNFSFDLTLIIPIVFCLFPLKGKHILIMDRTNWKWGKSSINILMISFAYLGISIPLFWSVLDSKGTSSVLDRVSLIKKALERFGIQKIKAFIADREFIGKEWFQYLTENKIPFLIRVKDSFLAEGICPECSLPLNTLTRRLGKKKKLINHFVNLWGYPLQVSVKIKKNHKDSLILVSNIKYKNPFSIYKRRWEIESAPQARKEEGLDAKDQKLCG